MNSLFFNNCSFCGKNNISYPLHLYGDCNMCVDCGSEWIDGGNDSSDFCCKRCDYYPDNLDAIKQLIEKVSEKFLDNNDLIEDDIEDLQEDLIEKIFDSKPIISKTKFYDGDIEHYPYFLLNLNVKLKNFDYKEHCKYVFPYLESFENDGLFYFPRGNNFYFLITSNRYHLEIDSINVCDRMKSLRSEGSFDYYRLLYSDIFCSILYITEVMNEMKGIEDVTPNMLEDRLKETLNSDGYYKKYGFCKDVKEKKIISNLFKKKPCYLKCDDKFDINKFQDNKYRKEIFTLLLINNRLFSRLPSEMLFLIFDMMINIRDCWCYIFKTTKMTI